jgi:hypothetical protein
MSDRQDTIDITGLDKAVVLATLFNHSRQQGMGFLDSSGTKNMIVEDARQVYANSKGYFDYLRGRVMKVDISGDSLDPWGYDRDNGQGAARRALESWIRPSQRCEETD